MRTFQKCVLLQRVVHRHLEKGIQAGNRHQSPVAFPTPTIHLLMADTEVDVFAAEGRLVHEGFSPYLRSCSSGKLYIWTTFPFPS